MQVLTTSRCCPGADLVLARPLFSVVLLGVVASLVPAASAALVDAREDRIPDNLVLYTAMLPVVGALGAMLAGDPSVALGAIAGAGAFGLPVLATHLVSAQAMGLGDVKLAVALGLLVGTIDARLAPIALCAACGSTLVVAVATRRSALPLGPGLVAGTAVVLASAFVREVG